MRPARRAAWLLAAVLLAPGASWVCAAQPEISLQQVFQGVRFQRPLALLQAPGADAWYVVEQRGMVWRMADAGHRKTLFADIRARVDDGPNEAGLLGMAFHPDYPQTPLVYLSYTRPGSPLRSIIAEFRLGDRTQRLDPDSERVLLALDQPYGNHNGGQIAFGPDGDLYIGFGDGGAGGDPHGNGQNTGTLLGALLRIAVHPDGRYTIPPDNPFAAGGGRPELFAWGLRNPWRWSFDRATGDLWLGDVGQDRWEEIDRVVRGGNYGWNIREGAHCYDAEQCRTRGLIDPVAEYSHAEGCSVTGGYVYRGERLPRLQGTYIYGDYCSGRIWGLSADAPGPKAARLLLDSGRRIASFGQGHDGELYVVDHGGAIYRLASPSR